MDEEIPGTLTIMVIYLVLFTIGFILIFWNLGTKWAIG